MLWEVSDFPKAKFTLCLRYLGPSMWHWVSLLRVQRCLKTLFYINLKINSAVKQDFKSFSKLLINCLTANQPLTRAQINRICVGRTMAKIFLLLLEKQTKKLSSQYNLPAPGKRSKSALIMNMHVYNMSKYACLQGSDPPWGPEELQFNSCRVQVRFLLAAGLHGLGVQILPVEQNRKCHLERVLHHSFPVWRKQTGQGEEYSIHLQPSASLEIRLKELFAMMSLFSK